MPEAAKILGQINPGTGGHVNIYFPPANTQAVVSKIVVHNTSGSVTGDFNMYARKSGEAASTANVILARQTIAPYEVMEIDVGMALAAGEAVSVYVTTGTNTLSFQAFGVEVS